MADRMKPNNWKMSPDIRAPPNTSDGGSRPSLKERKFPKAPSMQPSSKIVAENRAQKKEDENNMYLRITPPGQTGKLFEARQIIAGKHLVPLGLDQKEVFDNIRLKNKTWISYDGDCVISLASEHPLQLKRACQDLYGLVRDLRLTSERPAKRFIVQRPSPWLKNAERARISVVTGSRPTVYHDDKPTKTCIVPVVDDLVSKMASDLAPLATILTGLDKDLQMRASFGRLNLQKKKKSVGDQISYSDLPSVMKPYATRGGASLGSKLPIHDEGSFPQLPEVRQVLNHLTHSTTGVIPGMKDVTLEHTLIITLVSESENDDQREIRADMSQHSLGEPHMRAVETFPRVDWTILAPDREYDWNLRISAKKSIDKVPDEFLALLKMTTAQSIENQDEKLFKVRKLNFDDENGHKARHLDEQIKFVQVKTSACIPLEHDPYIVEVSVVQTRPGLGMTKPDLSWGIEFYGSQWEESLNSKAPGGLRKDWGRGLANVWPNSNQGAVPGGSKGVDGLQPFEKRFGHFLSCILKAQAALEGLEVEELSEALI